MATQFHFRRIPHLYDRSRPCPVWFSSKSSPSPIGHDSSVFFFFFLVDYDEKNSDLSMAKFESG